MAEPRPITRDVLAKFLPDPESIRRFEKLFYAVSELTPSEIAALKALVQEASIDANTAQATAQSALDQLGQIIQDAAINAGSADGKATQALGLLSSIAQSLEMLALSPVSPLGVQPEDLSLPRSPMKVDELADADVSTPVAGELLIYDATLRRWENHLLTPGTNVAITNADGSIAISVASAAPSGAAGGVLSGTYPNPGFAVDMATQSELDTAIGTREPTIAAGTTSQYWRGDKSWQDLASAVRTTVLTGLSTATNAVITAADSVLSALGKLQKQVSDNLTTLTTHTGATAAHGATGAVVGTTNTQTLTNKTINLASNTLAATSAQLAAAVTDETGSGALVFGTSPTLATPKATTTIGVGNATPSASGAGITFPATQSASTDANTLDDYEEGTWTPTVVSASGVVTLTGSVGQYTKIGRWVHFICSVTMNTDASVGTSNLSIGGLPFTPANTNQLAWLAGSNWSAGDYANGASGMVIIGTTTTMLHQVRTIDISSRTGSTWWYVGSYQVA